MKETTREHVSALVDGELFDTELESALAALRQEDGRGDWDIYHQIGDVLRSEDMAVGFSPGFAARMAVRLDAEPAIVAPAPLVANPGTKDPKQNASVAHGSRTRRWAISGMAATAMASLAFITMPHLMVAIKGEEVAPDTLRQMTAGNARADEASVASSSEGVVLRDPRIDDYLMAHQRFSPSVYSTAQFARSATFATDSNK